MLTPTVAEAAQFRWPWKREQNRLALTRADEAFLDEMERRGCLFFMEQADPVSGQVMDRARASNNDGKLDPGNLASIAATGFGLTALCIADKRKYFPHEQILEQVRKTLAFHWNDMPHQHGFYWHFSNARTGKPAIWSEVSSIDTALLLCGVLTARAYFKDPVITDLATKIYNRVDWPWMLNDGKAFSMGWHEKTGFIGTRWSHYCELMMIYLLAIGSPTLPVPATAWDAFTRPKMKFEDFEYISDPDPLFVHQYSHAYFDFRDKKDAYADYFGNSVVATRAHKAWCLSINKGYTEDYWGVTASDTKGGYWAWGGPPMLGPVDGTVVPCAVGGSLPFLPADCLRVLHSLQNNFGEKAWGRYGFCDALHPADKWYGQDVLGIDLGISVLMAENLRSGFVWETFMKNREAVVAMEKCGFRKA